MTKNIPWKHPKYILIFCVLCAENMILSMVPLHDLWEDRKK